MSDEILNESPSFLAVSAGKLLSLSGRRMAQGIKDGDFSATDLISASLKRAHEINPTLNAFCQILDDEALSKAKAADAAIANGDAVGPLHGVPIAVKDLTPTKGHLTSCGSWALGDWVPDETALCIRRLEAAGAIVIGKTTTPEFAFSAFTQSPRWGVTRNPWNPDRTSGGSSGGSAVAVATGCVPFAEGTDMGGSIRIPASCCGIVGLKPSLGRIPMTILPTVFDNISHFGPLAKSVDDAMLFLEVASGSSDQDINSLTVPFKMKKSHEKPLKKMRMSYSLDQGYYEIDPGVQSAFEAVLDNLKSAGADVRPVDLNWSREINDKWYDYWCVYMASFFGHLLEEFSERMDPNVAAGIRHGQTLSGVQFKSIEILRTKIWLELATALDGNDCFLTPTCAIPAPPATDDDTNYISNLPDGRYGGFEMTCVFNFLSACPVLSLPIGKTDNGLPVGLQIIGHRNQDERVLAISSEIEKLLAKTGTWPV